MSLAFWANQRALVVIFRHAVAVGVVVGVVVGVAVGVVVGVVIGVAVGVVVGVVDLESASEVALNIESLLFVVGVIIVGVSFRR
ncbi:hypothetical protein C2G38_2196854 [Gigaspora rosea]|uniref:Uncharacterized protein n=1 Tax=Gigaspora rosea TaxID=44941 RepID=A0A397UU62_9GLOM|nr:hypothetical protein C2G38_2196854 [Gigaspora rosea]